MMYLRPARVLSILMMVALAWLNLLERVQGEPLPELPLAKAPPRIAEVLPGDVILFLHLPDVTATLKAYEGSDLKKAVEAPETVVMRETLWATLGRWIPNFDEKGVPISGKEKLDQFAAIALQATPLLQGEAFIAWSGVNSSPEKDTLRFSGKIIAGVKPKAGTGVYDAYVSVVKALLIARGNNLSEMTGSDTVEGVPYEYMLGPGPRFDRQYKEKRLCFAKYNGWVLISAGESGLADFIQRSSGKKQGSLAELASARKSWGQLHADADGQMIIDVAGVRKTVRELNAPTKAVILLDSILDQGTSIMSWSAKFRGPLLEDRYSNTMLPKSTIYRAVFGKPCTFDTLRYTTPSTVLYSAIHMDWPALMKALPELDTEEENISDYAEEARAELATLKLNLDDIVAALGSELCVVADFEANRGPEAAILLRLSKPEKLEELFAKALEGFEQNSDLGIEEIKTRATTETIGEFKVLVISYPKYPKIRPTIVTVGGWLAQPVLGIFSSRAAAVRLLTQPPASKTVADQPFFQVALPGGFKEYSALTYIDTPVMLNQSEPGLRKLFSVFVNFIPKIHLMPELANLTLPKKLVLPDLMGAQIEAEQMGPDGDMTISTSLSGAGNQIGYIFALMMSGIAVVEYSMEESAKVEAEEQK
ncbi:MAG: hypothetical protein ACAI35_17865 [Candidatus Methylacidiphilales bacterium]